MPFVWRKGWRVLIDRIWLRDCRFEACHGVLPEEQEHRQWFSVNIEAWLDVRAAAAADDVTLTADYRQLWEAARDVMEGSPRALLETLAETIAAAILKPPLKRVRVAVEKLAPPLGGPVGTVGAEVTRE